jgi:cyclic beta-1,2-glucan synthetase
MYRVALESILGVTLERGRALRLRPCIPAAWPGFTVRYRLPDGDTTYEIVVRRGAPGIATSVRASTGSKANVDGYGVRIDLATDGAHHRVEVTLGDDVVPRYRPRADD